MRYEPLAAPREAGGGRADFGHRRRAPIPTTLIREFTLVSGENAVIWPWSPPNGFEQRTGSIFVPGHLGFIEEILPCPRIRNDFPKALRW